MAILLTVVALLLSKEFKCISARWALRIYASWKPLLLFFYLGFTGTTPIALFEKTELAGASQALGVRWGHEEQDIEGATAS
jgi:hypothetical protein